MPTEDLKALLTGRTTNLQTIKFKDQQKEHVSQVKLSVQRFSDGSLNLMVHPIRREIQNEDKLNEQHLDKLKQGETVIAPMTSMNGEKELHLYQLDRETNEIVKTRLNSISVPTYNNWKKPQLIQSKYIYCINFLIYTGRNLQPKQSQQLCIDKDLLI